MRHIKKPTHGSRSKPGATKLRATSKTASKAPSKATGSIRIISGQWRGRKLPVLDADGLRPTTDRTKETLFNWLMTDIAGLTCLDAFAGSGSLGFEALSRGATFVTFFEKEKAATRQLQQNIQLLALSPEQARVQNGDAIALLKALPAQSQDVIFLDPPFHQSLVAPALASIEQGKVLKLGGLLYLEMEQPEPIVPDPARWETVKIKTTSQFSYRLLRAVKPL